jgi:hypothetical protein
MKGQVHIVTGHDHVCEVTYWKGYRGLCYGVRPGMLADSCLDPMFVHYLEGRMPRWQTGFAVLTYQGGLLLPPELCQMWHGKMVFRNEIIPTVY